jgi:hypothetical protein
MAFTLNLKQDKDSVTGSVFSPIGGAQISTGSFHRHVLEIHIDSPQANYVLRGTLSKDALTGTWSTDTEKGTWTAKKKTSASE